MFGIFKNNKSNNDTTKHLITEPEILTLFTEDELAFLVHHNIDPEDVFDALWSILILSNSMRRTKTIQQAYKFSRRPIRAKLCITTSS